MTDRAELRLKVLELAREMLHNSYVETKARLHNEWALKSDITWKTTQRMLPYPQLPDYFTESDVLRKAQVLWMFVHAEEGALIQAEPTIPEPEPEVTPDYPESDPDPEPIMLTNQQPYAEMPQPAILPGLTPTPNVTSESLSPADNIPDNTAPSNRGLKVLPAWMTAKRN